MSDGYTGVKRYPTNRTALYGKGFFSLLATVMHPLSRRTVHINATNPLGKPIINPNCLSNDYDLQAAIAVIKKYRLIATTPPPSEVWDLSPGLNNMKPTPNERIPFSIPRSPFTIQSEPVLCSGRRQEASLIRS